MTMHFIASKFVRQLIVTAAISLALIFAFSMGRIVGAQEVVNGTEAGIRDHWRKLQYSPQPLSASKSEL